MHQDRPLLLHTLHTAEVAAGEQTLLGVLLGPTDHLHVAGLLAGPGVADAQPLAHLMHVDRGPLRVVEHRDPIREALDLGKGTLIGVQAAHVFGGQGQHEQRRQHDGHARKHARLPGPPGPECEHAHSHGHGGDQRGHRGGVQRDVTGQGRERGRQQGEDHGHGHGGAHDQGGRGRGVVDPRAHQPARGQQPHEEHAADGDRGQQ